jgi:hypothetical protein
MPKHLYIFAPTGDLWPAASLDARLPKIPIVDARGQPVLDKKKNPKTIPPHLWLDRNRPVEQMTWAPGEPQVVSGKLAVEGGWVARKGVAAFNLYLPPQVRPGDPAKADRWVHLIQRIYPDHWRHIVAFCAHRIQRPAEKINHALVLAGSPGIGKDTILEPLVHGVGPWNFGEVSAHDVMGTYTGYARNVVLRISETRDLGDVSRYDYYNKTKTLSAAPPDMLLVNTKYVPQFYVPNVLAIIATTNHETDGLYLPADDRRHYVAGTDITYKDHAEGYLPGIWDWYAAGGVWDVVAYLASFDLSAFDAKGPPVKTPAFWRMVDGGAASELPEFRDALEKAGEKGEMPAVVTVATVAMHAEFELKKWMSDPKNKRNIARRLADCGYVPVRNLDTKDGRWKIDEIKHTIYGRRDLSGTDRYRAVESMRDKVETALAELKAKIGSHIPKNG